MTVDTRDHDVVIVGAGNAGIALAAQLRRASVTDITIIDPKPVHTYQPLLSYVGAGRASLRRIRKPQRSVVPSGVELIPEDVAGIDADSDTVRLGNDASIRYKTLVVCPGSLPDLDAIPGSQRALAGGRCSTNYLPESAPHTWDLVRGLRAGIAVFTVIDRPVPCGGVAYKPLFMACDYWQQHGVLGDIEVIALVESERLFGVDRVDEELDKAARRYGVQVRTGVRLTGLDSHGVTYERSGSATRLPYDMLHLVPPHRAPDFIAASGLAVGDTSFLDVDPRTLRSRAYPNVWGLGDAADTRSSKSGGALRHQVPIVKDNILAAEKGQALTEYDGYSVAPITTSGSELLLAEFDRDFRPAPSSKVDLFIPRRATYLYDLYLQPRIYWQGILKGRL